MKMFFVAAFLLCSCAHVTTVTRKCPDGSTVEVNVIPTKDNYLFSISIQNRTRIKCLQKISESDK